MHIRAIDNLLKQFQPSQTQILIILSIFVGLATAGGALGFIALIKYFNRLFFGMTDQFLTEAIGSAGFCFKYWFPVIPLL
ncbi:MAG: hypothetical protein AB1744_04970, partial [Candidatus Zixiibacteriota bacterium]